MRRNLSVQKMALTAMMAALITVFSWISIPLPSGVPVTLQTLGIALAGYVLGPLWGAVSVFVWLLLGIVGLPVFAGFGSGIGSLLGLTGGFLFGFPILAALCGLGRRWPTAAAIGCGLLGLAVTDALGALQYAWLSGISFGAAFLLVAAPYLLKDGICIVLTAAAARQINRAVTAGLKSN